MQVSYNLIRLVFQDDVQRMNDSRTGKGSVSRQKV